MTISHSSDDAMIADLITAATRYVENFTRRSLMPVTLTETFSCFPPGDDPLVLSRPPLASVPTGGVTYTASTGNTVTMTTDEYVVDVASVPGRLTPAYNTEWPTAVRDIPNAVQVDFVAGSTEVDAAAPGAVPETLRLAIKMLTLHWYDHRTPVVTGTVAAKIPLHIESLMLSARWGSYV
jgi:uncharacterized phiE125 gp8 family phage protein